MAEGFLDLGPPSLRRRREFFGTSVAARRREFFGTSVAARRREFFGTSVAARRREFFGTSVAARRREFFGTSVAARRRESSRAGPTHNARFYYGIVLENGSTLGVFANMLRICYRISAQSTNVSI
jgi:hypothetical protein